MKFIINSPKYGKHTVLIDDEDAEKVLKYSWRVCYRVRNGKDVLCNIRTHIKRNGKMTSLYLHRLIVPDCEMVDHVDNSPLNNKKDNLRPCNASENMRNRRVYRNNKLGSKGVYFSTKTNKYCAQIQCNKQRYNLGQYDTLERAVSAYNKAARRLHGQFAKFSKARKQAS